MEIRNQIENFDLSISKTGRILQLSWPVLGLGLGYSAWESWPSWSWTIVGISLIHQACWLRGMLSVRSRIFGPTVWHGSANRPLCALTFDDGPSPIATEKTLDALEEIGLKATFFVVGQHAQQYPQLMRRIVAAGHAIGNHTYSHAALFSAWPRRYVLRDLQRCNAIVHDITGVRPCAFRPPAGLRSPAMYQACQRLGLPIVGWTVRGLDTVSRSPLTIFNRINNGLGPGSIIVLHDGATLLSSRDRSGTLAALQLIFREMSNRGITAVTIPELLQLQL